jgi:transcriptional regulator with XRE-family HTH domain
MGAILAVAAHSRLTWQLAGKARGNRRATAGGHDGIVDPIRLGRYVRAVRQQLGLRQRDVAARARVSASGISRVERGRLREVSWSVVEDVCASLEVSLDLRPSWRGFEGHRLLDADHAVIVDYLAGVLRRLGWDVVVEYTFNHYGDRGSVDVLAWHAATRSLLIAEVKSRIVDIQDLLSSVDRKARVVPLLVRLERGWIAVNVGRLVVVRGTRSARAAVERHRATFEVALPTQTRASRRWLRSPSGPLAGVLFVADSRVAALTHGRRRINRRARALSPRCPHD